jgi:peptidoglycan/LPS O-acetylase OafA/YrhL
MTPFIMVRSMNKPVFGLVLGGVLGIFDGLSALVSSPEVSSQIAGIVMGSTFKGLIAGVLIGWFSKKVSSLPLGIVFGLIVGAALALPIAIMNSNALHHNYYWQIVLPGRIVGLIVGYATQRHEPSGSVARA